MAITYTWTIDKLMISTAGGFNNAVVQTYWTCAGTDEAGNTGTFKGATPLTVVEGTGTFVPYEELDEATVLGWVKDVVHADERYSSHINSVILQQIADLSAVKVEVRSHELPWADPNAVVQTAADLNPPLPKEE
jgi:hypothetical protein